MIEVAHAATADIAPLIELESALFRKDAGKHDPYADPTWPEREGRADFEDLIASPDGIVLLARRSDHIVGLLAGYAARAPSSRQPIDAAVLRTMYVAATVRRLGVGTMLTERFLDWARASGCAEARVDHYAANTSAGLLYEHCGFEVRSISRLRLL